MRHEKQTIEEQIAAYKLNPVAQQARWDSEQAENDRWNIHGTLKSDSSISKEMDES